MVNIDVKFHEDVISSHSRDSPSMFEEKVEIIIQEFHSEVEARSDSRVDEVRLGMDMPSATIPACGKPKWLT